MTPEKLLEILHLAERLKDVPRHCVTSGGRRESVAEHSWRITLMAYLVSDEFPEADIAKVMKMCLIHDLGEAFTGDIPTFLKTAADEAREEELLNALAILVGKMPGELHDELGECPRRDWLIEPSRLESAPLNLIRARPDVRASERRLAARTAAVGVAKSLWYPKLYINGSLGLESVKAAKFLKRDALYGSIGPSFSWPLFQGGNLYANEQAEEAAMREAFLAYELSLENAYREVRDAYATYTREFHRYEALKGALEAARDAVAISNDLYKNGLKDFTAVIDAQRSLLRLHESVVVSRGQITENAIALYKALGGGLALDETSSARR